MKFSTIDPVHVDNGSDLEWSGIGADWAERHIVVTTASEAALIVIDVPAVRFDTQTDTHAHAHRQADRQTDTHHTHTHSLSHTLTLSHPLLPSAKCCSIFRSLATTADTTLRRRWCRRRLPTTVRSSPVGYRARAHTSLNDPPSPPAHLLSFWLLLPFLVLFFCFFLLTLPLWNARRAEDGTPVSAVHVLSVDDHHARWHAAVRARADIES